MTRPVVPHSRESEEALIGASMLNPEVVREVEGIVATPDFYYHHNRWVWDAITSVYNRKDPVDIITVMEELDRKGREFELTDLYKVMNNVPSSLHGEAYAKRIAELSTRRKIIEAGTAQVNDAYDETKSINEIVSTRSRELSELSTVEDTGEPLVKIISEAIDVVADRINKRARGETIEIGYQTGIGCIDRNFKGLKRGWLVYWAGSANIGKTQAAIQVSKVFGKQGAGSYVALEGDKASMAYRMLEGVMRKDAVDIEFGKVDATALYKTLEEFEGLDYEFWYQPRLSVHELRAYVNKQRIERNLEWMVVDYISLLGVEGKDRNEKDENMSQELRRIASEFNILLVGLDSIVKSGSTKILSLEDIAGRYSKQHDSDITFGYSDYKVVKGIAPELDDAERQRHCRLLGVLKDRHRKQKSKLFPLEMVDGLVMDLVVEDDVYIPDYIHN